MLSQFKSFISAPYRLIFVSSEKVQIGEGRTCSLQFSLPFRENQKPFKWRKGFLLPPITILEVSHGKECKSHSSTKYHNLHARTSLQQIMMQLLDNTYLSFKHLVLQFLFTTTQDHITSPPTSIQPPNFWAHFKQDKPEHPPYFNFWYNLYRTPAANLICR